MPFFQEEIEAQGNHKCCVIYGALPPETRRQQAKLFNDPDSGYNVLVASDAIGMGLNLNIRRMVFSKMEKFSGGATKDPIPHSMVSPKACTWVCWGEMLFGGCQTQSQILHGQSSAKDSWISEAMPVENVCCRNNVWFLG